MKRLMLILVFALLGLVTNESPAEMYDCDVKYYQVGRFTVAELVRKYKGKTVEVEYQARTGDTVSSYHNRMFNAINEIQNEHN